jgi:PEP-CTERM motif-containing protein
MMTKIISRIMLGCAAALLITLSGTNAFADGIVLVGPDPCFPAGVGRGCGSDRSPHILSIQEHPLESGGVRFSSGGDVRFGDWTRGSNTQTRTLAEAGITNANDLRLFFDIIEPNGGNQSSILLTSLILTAHNDAGVEVFRAVLVGGPLDLEELGNGQGHSDYVFALDAAAALRLQAVFAPTLHIGLEATIDNAQAGPESFFIGSANGPGPAPVPEPATMLLMGTGLAGTAAAVRRRSKSRKV